MVAPVLTIADLPIVVAMLTMAPATSTEPSPIVTSAPTIALGCTTVASLAPAAASLSCQASRVRLSPIATIAPPNSRARASMSADVPMTVHLDATQRPGRDGIVEEADLRPPGGGSAIGHHLAVAAGAEDCKQSGYGWPPNFSMVAEPAALMPSR